MTPRRLVFGATVLATAALLIPTTARLVGADDVEAGHVEIDAIALDHDGNSVQRLTKDDFQIREDGQPVAIDSFSEVTSLGADGRADARRIVLLLDDTMTTRADLTFAVRKIANLFVARMGSADALSVVRVSRSDEAAGDQGDQKEALARIADYRAGWATVGRGTLEGLLTKVTSLSNQFADADHHRAVIVGIGSPGLFDVEIPFARGTNMLWPYWLKAVIAASRANTSVYAISPAGTTRQFLMANPGGLTAQTGGDAFYNSNDFEKAVEQIWNESSHYYLLGYTPTSASREFHDVKVSSSRAGIRVRARRIRG